MRVKEHDIIFSNSHFQCHALSEIMMEHLAHELGLDPLQFRIDNLLKEGDILFEGGEEYTGVNPLEAMLNQLRTDCSYDDRAAEVAAFNAANAWKKRGLVMLPMRWRHSYGITMHYAAQVKEM